jgi:hypothetical protein
MDERDRAYHAVTAFALLLTGIGLTFSGFAGSGIFFDRGAAEEIGLLVGYPLLLISTVAYVLILGRRLRLVLDTVGILLMTGVMLPCIGVGLIGKMLAPVASLIVGVVILAVSLRPFLRDALPAFKRQDPP